MNGENAADSSLGPTDETPKNLLMTVSLLPIFYKPHLGIPM